MTNARTAKSTREKAAELRALELQRQARRRALAVSAAVAAVILVVVAAVIIVKSAQQGQQQKEAAASAPPANLTDGGILVGRTTAPVTVELYEDFQCPVCKQFEVGNAAQLASWAAAGTAKLIYHPVAILDTQSSDYSTRALNAAGAVAAADPALFPAFHTLLFDNQPAEGSTGLTDTQLIDYAVQAGAERAAVGPAITGGRYRSWAATVTDQFSKKGFNGTPTVVVNGTKLDGFTPETVKAAVEAAAKK